MVKAEGDATMSVSSVGSKSRPVNPTWVQAKGAASERNPERIVAGVNSATLANSPSVMAR